MDGATAGAEAKIMDKGGAGLGVGASILTKDHRLIIQKDRTRQVL